MHASYLKHFLKCCIATKREWVYCNTIVRIKDSFTLLLYIIHWYCLKSRNGRSRNPS